MNIIKYKKKKEEEKGYGVRSFCEAKRQGKNKM